MSYTERKRADRDAMAKAIVALAAEYGFKVERDDERDETRVNIETTRSLCATIWFERATQSPDVHVIPWHIRRGDAQLAPGFGYVAGGEVNPHHFRKCTAVQRGWDALYASLRRVFDCARDGSAFKPEEPPEPEATPRVGPPRRITEDKAQRIAHGAANATRAWLDQGATGRIPEGVMLKPGETMKHAIGRYMGARKRAWKSPEARTFPHWHPGMTTAQYVRDYYADNGLSHGDYGYPQSFLTMPDRAAPYIEGEHWTTQQPVKGAA